MSSQYCFLPLGWVDTTTAGVEPAVYIQRGWRTLPSWLVSYAATMGACPSREELLQFLTSVADDLGVTVNDVFSRWQSLGDTDAYVLVTQWDPEDAKVRKEFTLQDFEMIMLQQGLEDQHARIQNGLAEVTTEKQTVTLDGVAYTVGRISCENNAPIAVAITVFAEATQTDRDVVENIMVENLKSLVQSRVFYLDPLYELPPAP